MMHWSRQNFFAVFALLCCGLISSLSGDAPRVIILFTADNIGPGDLDQERIELPNLKFLQEQSTRFDNYHSSSPLKSSAFYSLYTGIDTGKHAYRDTAQTYLSLAENTPLIAKKLLELKYETVFSGSWPFGENEDLLPSKFGFNYFYGYFNRPDQHPRFPSSLQFNQDKIELSNIFIPRNYKFSPDSEVDKPSIYQQFQGKEYAPKTVHRALLNFLRKKLEAKEKLFLHYGQSGLRPGLQPNPDDLKITLGRIPDIPYAGQKGYTPSFSPRAAQMALLIEMDRQLGDLIKLLKDLEIFDQSLIIFTSPNSVSENGGRDIQFFSSNQELKGSRGSLFQGGLRIPCIAYWPELLKKNHRNSDLMSQTNLLQSITSVATGENKPIFLPQAELYWENEAFRALRKGKYKLIQKKSLLTPSYVQLYDLEADPSEANNIAEDKAEDLKTLIELADSLHINIPSHPSPFDLAPAEAAN